MIEVRRLLVVPWDYTVYRADDGCLIVKIVFTEGDRKLDVGRFFKVSSRQTCLSADQIGTIVSSIRQDYPDVAYQQLAKSSLKFIE